MRKRLKKEASSEDEDDEEPAEPPVNIATPLKRGRKSLKTPDSRECFRTRGPGKGERSFKLSQDLFQGRHTDFIYVCHACYAYFETGIFGLVIGLPIQKRREIYFYFFGWLV